jgi:3-oxoacyl-(acyl-carrier-protein) synthase
VAAAQVKDTPHQTNAEETGRRALGAQEPRGMAFALTAAAEAVTASGGADALRSAYSDGDGIGVAFGTGISGVEELLGAQAALQTRGFRRVSPYLVPNSLVNMAAGRISIANGFRGPNHAVSTACATGAHAIGDAFRFIKYGDADVSAWLLRLLLSAARLTKKNESGPTRHGHWPLRGAHRLDRVYLPRVL